VFKDGAFTSKDARVRAYAVQKTMRAMDLGVELGAKIYVFWGGREGAEADATKDPRAALGWMRECINFLCEYAIDQRYDLRFALEPKPNEPRGDLYLPTIGHMLHFITTLDHSGMVGVNPEVAHESMAGLSFFHGVAQAMDAGKLFHIDLNAQRIGRFDQDLRFGSEDLRQAFLLVRLLEGTAGGGVYEGPLHFDSHAYRTEDLDGVWDFVRGSMRTYLILKDKAHRFDSDPEVRGLIEDMRNDHAGLAGALRSYSKTHRESVQGMEQDIDSIARRGLKAEALDQLMMEHLMGVRGERA
jgi:xylose isomerase